MTSTRSWRATILGLNLGAYTAAIAVLTFKLDPSRYWTIQFLQFSSWLGYFAGFHWYTGCFPIINPWTEASFIIFGSAFQWGMIGLVCDLVRKIRAARRRRRLFL